ncbi:MAG: restriction endonuclease subunit S [Treponema sp.]
MNLSSYCRPYEKVGEEPFEIPHSWKWVRLGAVCDYGKCINVSTSDLRANDWILDLEDIEKDSGKILAFHTLKERKSESTKHKFTKGQVLYSKLRPYLNKVVIAPKDGFCTSEILPLDFNEILLNRFAQIVLMASYFLTLVNMVTYGVKMPRLGTGDAKNMLIPIPPLNEQKRIVSKIDELFSNLDQIQNNLI